MALFLDSSNVEEIKKFMGMGIIEGVTTNPSILLKDGVKGSLEEIKPKILEIAQLIFPYPLSVELTTNEKDKMFEQVEMIHRWMCYTRDTYLNIKIPIHGPNCESNLDIIKKAKEELISINVTAMMSAQQCLLAALAGADYVSMFGGRIADQGYDVVREIKSLRTIIDEWYLPSKLILGSVREVSNIIDWANAGAHVITVPPAILDKMIVNARTKETIRDFLDDAKK
jgi:transaldolase